MPEGDTVWLAGRRLDQALAGSSLRKTDFRVPRHATVDLSPRVVIGVATRGKHLLMRIEGGLTLHTHLRMDGSWHLYRTGRPRSGAPDWQIRVLLLTDDWQAVGYRLPVVELLETTREADAVGHLGPDLLGADWDPAVAVQRLLAAPDRAIGEALLDQRNLAGIGNLYRSELCFLHGVTPWTAVSVVDHLPALVARAHTLLDANKQAPAQVTTGDPRVGQQHWVFQRSRCRRCGTRVSTAWQGQAPQQRVAYWCPRCQSGPAPQPQPPRASPPRRSSARSP